ncbi:MAG: hypothetical protein HKN51_10815 [Saprospiraceae bacterium]|nr:hypothetical protein [Saprospiraceae bacterium]
MKHLKLVILFLITQNIYSQTTITFDDDAANKMYIRLYAHVDYNQKIEANKRTPGKMDVHRVVTLFGYQFNRKTQFVTEIEVEHVKEIYVEQAFVKHRLTKGINLKAGLLLIPMGFVNEMHEPTFFYSVERPLLDKNIIPTTWREIGFGISGLFPKNSLKYQLYLVNNPISFNDSGTINGEKGFRSGRQKGAESTVTSLPGLSGQIEYFGWDGIKVGLSAYHGKTNTSLVNNFNGLQTPESTEVIDSSTVTLSMATLHAAMNKNQWTTRFQYTMTKFSNVVQYNAFANSDVPELMHGFYFLMAYDLIKNQNISFEPFVRYSHLNNHLRVSDNLEKNSALKQDIITLGFNYKPDPGVVFKIDFQFYNLGNNTNYQQFNTGIGVWF